MSQSDDELLTLLRAELARRANTAPREGFDMRVHQTVRNLQRPHGHAYRLFGAGVALVAVAAVAVAVAVSAGLRLHHDNRGAVPPLPTPSAAPKGDLFVLVQPGGTGVNYSAPTIRFVRQDGRLVRALPFPGGPNALHDYESAAGGQLFYVTTGVQDERLQSVGVDGVVHDHGSLTTDGRQVTGLSLSSDGRRWAWLSPDAPTPGATSIHIRLLVAGVGETAHVLLDETGPTGFGISFTDVVLGWTDRGILLAQQPTGLGGGPFQGSYWHKPRLVDPHTGAVRALDDPKNSAFYGVGSDGTYANAIAPSTVNTVDPRGGQRHATIAAPVVTAFAALVAPDAVHVAVGVREQDGGPDGGPVIRTDVIDMASGRATHQVPSGYAPQAWLQDGSLVVYSIYVDSSSARSVEVLAPGGRVTDIGPGDYVGTVRG